MSIVPYQPEQTAYLLVGHGTRNVAGQQQFLQVYQQFAELMAPARCGCAFLELADPGIEQAIVDLAGRGVQRLITVPLLLFAAGHALEDIPQAVAQAATALGLTVAGQTPPLELHPAVVELSALRFRQAVCQREAAPSCLATCERRHCGHIALAMIGRGSRSEAAAENMRCFAHLRRQLTPVTQLHTGFVFGQHPTVTEVLDALANSQCPIAVVQPHLLFEGELISQLREQVAGYARRYPSQKWLVTPTLGTDFALARTLAQLAEEPVMCI